MLRLDKQQFKAAIFEMTKPLNGQYPRPWMTKLRNPLDAEVFVVGRNQRNKYMAGAVSHERHVDALFNEEPGACRRLYDEIMIKPSRTRNNTDRLVTSLEMFGVHNVLETNVVCYSTPMSDDLRRRAHIDGARRGEEIFRFLLSSIKPKVLIVHGAGTSRKIKSILGCPLPAPPNCAGDSLSCCFRDKMLVIVIRSLAPPEYNKWHKWAPAHFTRVADAAARQVAVGRGLKQPQLRLEDRKD